MTFKPKIWLPISVILTLVNVAGAWIAAQAAEAPHATIHAILGAACAAWAMHLRRRSVDDGRVEELEGELDLMERQLAEANERLDFAERVLAQGEREKRER